MNVAIEIINTMIKETEHIIKQNKKALEKCKDECYADWEVPKDDIARENIEKGKYKLKVLRNILYRIEKEIGGYE